MLQGAIFDMDGTLVDSLGFWDFIWEEMGKRYLQREGFRPTPEDDRYVRTATILDGMCRIHKTYGIAESGEALFDFFKETLEVHYRTNTRCKAGVVAFLSYLQANGVRMCIASASEKRLVELTLKVCGIERFFCGIIACNDVGKGKEYPDVFLHAREFLGTPTEQTAVFEDSAVALAVAKRAGFLTVGIYDRHNYGTEELKEMADRFIGEGESLEKLIPWKLI